MNYRIRKAAVSLLAAGMTLGWAAMPVLGSAEAIVDGVDDHSSGDAYAYDDDDLSVENKNFGGVVNSDSSDSDTGGNSISGSEDENSIVSGAAGAGALSDNFLNSNLTSISGGGASALATVMNITVHSSGYAYAEDDDSLSVLNKNCWFHLPWWLLSKCKIDNSTTATADTGSNYISGSEDGNSISTGPADADALAVNVMNTNETDVSGWGASAHATVDGVDDHSSGDAYAYDDDTLDVTNKNFGKIHSHTDATADTGGNSISGSEDGNSIVTGGAGALAGSANFLNTNETSVSGGDGDGSADATVTAVTDHSSGYAYAEDDDTTTVENKNFGKVDNSTSATADTGSNYISGSEDGNSISSGDASSESSSSNTVNTNVTTISM